MKNKLRNIVSIFTVTAVILGISGIGNLSMAASVSAPSRIDVIIGFSQTPGSSEQALVRSSGGTIKHSYHLVPAIAARLNSRVAATAPWR